MRVRVAATQAWLLVPLLWGCAFSAPGWLPTWLGGPSPPEEHPPVVAQPASSLPAPEGLRAHSGEYRSISLQWDPLLSGHVGGYRLERADQREGPYLPVATVWGRGEIASADRGGDPPLGDSDTRYYRIRAFDRAGRLSENVSEVVVGTTAPLPDPPTGLRAYSRQPREVPLAWEPADDPRVAGYRVERSPSPEGPFETIAELDGRHASAYVDRGLGDLRVFFYRVAARNLGGATGPPSLPVRAVTKPEPLPPLGLRLSDQRLGVNLLAWEPNVEHDLAEYRLYRVVPNEPPRLVASVPADRTEARDASVAAGGEVTYALVAVDRDGLESRPSESIDVTGVDYGLRAEALPDGVHLHWDPRTAEGFVRARIEREGWLGRRALGTSDTGAFVDRAVEPGQVYTYVAVLERQGDEEAPPSRPVSVEVPAQVPEVGDFR
jgi:fibronectin type 3 domain-containing protein